MALNLQSIIQAAGSIALSPRASGIQIEAAGNAAPNLKLNRGLSSSQAFLGQPLLSPTAARIRPKNGGRRTRLDVEAFTRQQARLVSDSWEDMKPNADMHAMRLFSNIFQTTPQAMELFSFLRESGSPKEANMQLREHAVAVFKMTGEAAVQLGDKGAFKSMVPVLQSLGQRNFGYGAQPAHYDILKAALMQTLEEEFGPRLTPQLRGAWSQAFDELAEVVIDGEMMAEPHAPLPFFAVSEIMASFDLQTRAIVPEFQVAGFLLDTA